MATEIKEGYLTKRGDVVNSWKRRYFVLEKDMMRYYSGRHEKLLGQPKGEFSVRGARLLILDSDDYGREHVIGVTPKLSSRTYILSADSAEELDSWVSVLSAHGVMYKAPDATGFVANPTFETGHTRSGSIALTSSETKVDPRSIREGFLVKQGAVLKNWKRRYFALFPHTLHYYKHKGDVIPAGEIPLLAGSLVVEEDMTLKDKEHEGKVAFSIVPLLPDFSNRKYILLADSDQDRRAWVNSINSVSANLKSEYSAQFDEAHQHPPVSRLELTH